MIQPEPQVKSRVNKVSTKLGSNSTYYFYSVSVKNPQPLKLYRIIVNKFFIFLFKLILEGERVKLPEGLGNMYIAGRKANIRLSPDNKIIGSAPDWVRTKKLWDSNPEAKEAKRLVYHLNEATNGIIYKLHWDKGKVTSVVNQSFYSLQLARVNKRSIHRAIKAGKEYLVYNEL